MGTDRTAQPPPRPLPHCQHVSSGMAVEDEFEKPSRSRATPSRWSLGARLASAVFVIAHSWCGQRPRRSWFSSNWSRPSSSPLCLSYTWLVTGPDARGPHGLSEVVASRLRAHSVAASTFAKYATAFGYWRVWCRANATHVFLIGVDPHSALCAVESFIIHVHTVGFTTRTGLKAATIAGVLHGIRHFFASEGHTFPSSQPQISMLLKGIARLDAPQHHKAPVSLELMDAVYSSLNLERRADLALWGVLCLSLFFLLRRSEIVAVSGTKFKWFALKASDLVVVDVRGQPTTSPADAQAVYMTLRGSKTNQAGTTTVRHLKRSGHPVLCPSPEHSCCSIHAQVTQQTAQQPCTTTVSHRPASPQLTWQLRSSVGLMPQAISPVDSVRTHCEQEVPRSCTEPVSMDQRSKLTAGGRPSATSYTRPSASSRHATSHLT